MVRGVTIKDHWSEQRIFDQRSIAAGVLIVALVATLIVRLFILQVVRYDYYTELSQGNRVRIEPIPAARGLILDRNGEVIASNQPAFQLELIPEQVQDLNATLQGLIGLGLLEADELDEVKRTIKSRRPFDSVPIRLRMSEEDIARFAVHHFEFPGVNIETRQTRWYPNKDLAVHALGYVAAISESDLEKIDRQAYAGTTLIGKLGVEATYEKELHGTNGFHEVLVNAQGRSVSNRELTPELKERAAVPGEDLLLSIDMPSQRVAEELMADKRGSAVAIDPQTGDVLVLVSRPGFDPNLFGRGLTRAEFKELNDNIDHPLLNRALRGQYPSGSTIKPGLALAALVNHEVDPNATKYCNGIWHLPGSSLPFREGRSGRHHDVNLRQAIAKSCDVYFYDLAHTVEVDHIAAFLGQLGFGSLTGIDIAGEKAGLLPSKEWKRKAFKRPAEQVWYPGETVNFGVGQGYFLTTPLQLAHYVTILANRGISYTPRLVTGIRNPATGEIKKFAPKKNAELKNVTDEDWQIVQEGMAGTLRYGTAANTAGVKMTYTIAGKTGTAQVFTVGRNEKLDNQKTVADRLRDHSWFIAFAPAEHPRIAVALIVENGGFGSAVAAPIVRKIMDTYLLDANGQLKVPLPPGTPLLTPGPGYAPITPGKVAPPTKEEQSTEQSED